MFRLHHTIPFLLLLAAATTASEAEASSLPPSTTTYYVQVKYEFWRNGYTYWSTVYETNDADDAKLMYMALSIACDNGDICELLNCGVDWIVTDVRLTSKTTYNYNLVAPKYPQIDDLYLHK